MGAETRARGAAVALPVAAAAAQGEVPAPASLPASGGGRLGQWRGVPGAGVDVVVSVGVRRVAAAVIVGVFVLEDGSGLHESLRGGASVSSITVCVFRVGAGPEARRGGGVGVGWDGAGGGGTCSDVYFVFCF